MQALLMKVVAGVLLLAALAGLTVALVATRGELADTRTRLDEQALVVRDLRASQATLQRSVAAVRALQAKTSAEIRGALDKEPAFRDTPVPRSVSDGLCKRLKCSP